jgi:hypothetical protein
VSGLPQRTVRFLEVQLEPSEGDEWTARVRLSTAQAPRCIGASRGPRLDPEGLRLLAEATAKALVQAVGPADHELEVHGIEQVKVFGRRALVVYVSARHGDRRQSLMGFSVADTNPPKAAALAVLNAVNRFWGVG